MTKSEQMRKISLDSVKNETLYEEIIEKAKITAERGAFGVTYSFSVEKWPSQAQIYVTRERLKKEGFNVSETGCGFCINWEPEND